MQQKLLEIKSHQLKKKQKGNMLISLINKALLMVLVMSCLNLIRHTYYFIQAWLKSDEESPEKYKVSDKSLWLLSVSIGYIISSIFYGLFI